MEQESPTRLARAARRTFLCMLTAIVALTCLCAPAVRESPQVATSISGEGVVAEAYATNDVHDHVSGDVDHDVVRGDSTIPARDDASRLSHASHVSRMSVTSGALVRSDAQGKADKPTEKSKADAKVDKADAKEDSEPVEPPVEEVGPRTFDLDIAHHAEFDDYAHDDGGANRWLPGFYVGHDWSDFGQKVLAMDVGDVCRVDGYEFVVEGVREYPSQHPVDLIRSDVGTRCVCLQTCVPGAARIRIVYGDPGTGEDFWYPEPVTVTTVEDVDEGVVTETEDIETEPEPIAFAFAERAVRESVPEEMASCAVASSPAESPAESSAESSVASSSLESSIASPSAASDAV